MYKPVRGRGRVEFSIQAHQKVLARERDSKSERERDEIGGLREGGRQVGGWYEPG